MKTFNIRYDEIKEHVNIPGSWHIPSLTKMQRQAMKFINKHKKCLIQASRRSGKSYLLYNLLIDHINNNYDKQCNILLLFQSNQRKQFSIGEFIDVLNNIGIEFYIENNGSTIICDNLSICFSIISRSCDDFRGIIYNSIYVDDVDSFYSYTKTQIFNLLMCLVDVEHIIFTGTSIDISSETNKLTTYMNNNLSHFIYRGNNVKSQ